MAYGLTSRQAKLLAYLQAYRAEHGYGPCYDEIAEHLSLASRSSVNRLVKMLERRGVICFLPRVARSIRVIEESAPQPDLHSEVAALLKRYGFEAVARSVSSQGGRV